MMNELLIAEVEKRPAIYQKEGMYNKILKDQLWNEVAENVIPDWSTLSSEGQFEKIKELQAKWKNLKACFCREVKLQRNGMEKRKYIYFDSLLFLLPTIENGDTESNIQTPSNEQSPLPQVDDRRAEIKARKKGKNKNGQKSYEEQLLEILREKKEEEDEDKLFLLSLLPSFRKLALEEKFQAKIELMQVMQKFIIRYRPNPICYYSSSSSD